MIGRLALAWLVARANHADPIEVAVAVCRWRVAANRPYPNTESAAGIRARAAAIHG